MKIGNEDAKLYLGGSEVDKIYLGTEQVYGGSPSFSGKWIATYVGGTTSSAECDSSSAITQDEITLSNLTDVAIGDCVTSIGSSSFAHCNSLTSVTIGSGVTSISRYAFRGCSGLTSITVNATTPPTLANANVFNNTNNCPIYVPAESVETYKTANVWSTYASRIQAMP